MKTPSDLGLCDTGQFASMGAASAAGEVAADDAAGADTSAAELPAGDYAPFYDVLRFYAKVGGTLVDLRSFEGEIAAADDTRGTPSELITIYIQMDEEAGNEFMNKQVSNLLIQFYLYQKEASGAAAAWYGNAADGYSTVETATSEDAYGTRRKIEGAQ